MENLARHEFDRNIDEKVKQELQIAKIPVFTLPAWLNTEVKTKYVGMLNSFFFYRAWTYWICVGDMPMNVARYIYQEFKSLEIRAGGHAGNVDPREVSYNPIYKHDIAECFKKYSDDMEKYTEEAKKIVDDKTQRRYVDCYHIDTQLGLCKLADTIRDYQVHSEIKDLEKF